MTRLPYVVLDVFTKNPLEGNQLAVFLDARELTAEQMQRMARELNLSETVFVLPAEQDGHARIRIFTPTLELPFAGHPTLGTAFVIGERDDVSAVLLETGVGTIPIALEKDGDQVIFGRMSQQVPTLVPFVHADALLAALGISGSALPIEAYCNGPVHVYVELDNADAVAALRPDLAALRELGEIGVNCFAGHGGKWKTRMFGPGLGVNEDPATGSAAGPLGVHLARHGRIEFGTEIEISQGIELGRPSTLYTRVSGSAEQITQVEVGGAAVMVAKGEYRVN